MSVQVFWDNDERTVIMQQYEGVIAQEDYYATIDKVAEMIRSVSYPVHTIYDRSKVTIHPSTLVSVLRYGHRKMPANLGINVIVGGSQFTRVIVNIGTAIAPNLAKNVFFASTADEARAIIASELRKDSSV